MIIQSNSNFKLEGIISFIIAITTFSACQNSINENSTTIKNHSSSSSCVKVVHPVWTDENTELDQIYANNKTYDGALLKGFVKNMCLDTVIIHLNGWGLHVGANNYYFNNEEGYGEIIDDLTMKKIKLGPLDSVYLNLSVFNLYQADYIDSIRLVAYIESSNGEDLGILNIYKEDFYNRSLLFSEYYHLILSNHRKKSLQEDVEKQRG